MEIREHFTLEVTKGDNRFTLHIPKGASWGSCIDAAFDLMQKVGELHQQSIQNAKPTEQGEQ